MNHISLINFTHPARLRRATMAQLNVAMTTALDLKDARSAKVIAEQIQVVKKISQPKARQRESLKMIAAVAKLKGLNHVN